MVDHRSLCNPVVLKIMVFLGAFCLIGYIVGPSLYWHAVEVITALTHVSSCSPCICDCASQPLLTLPEGLTNASFADCAKREGDTNEETESNFTDLLAEELKLREAEALEERQKLDMQLLEAKKLTSQYQKEADKCNSGMWTCEEARERAEAALKTQKRLSEVWEKRAREHGWKERSKPLVTGREVLS